MWQARCAISTPHLVVTAILYRTVLCCAVQAANPQALSCCLASVARLRMPLDPGRVAALLDRGLDHLTEYAPKQLAGKHVCWVLCWGGLLHV